MLDDELLDRLQRGAFGYFLEHTNLTNGLVADTSRDGSPASIAVVGLGLSTYAVAVERGWLARDDAAARTLATLRFFEGSAQGSDPGATGHRGFYYHFLDRHTGQRVWQSELSPIDTALLLAGILTAGTYFSADTADEKQIRALAGELHGRVDWDWARNGKTTLAQGWKPESGFFHYGWEGYSEASLLYVLALASPTHPLPATSYTAWRSTYQWERIYGRDLLYAGPLFIHQFSHAWIDFRGIQDAFMKEKGSDYFENTRRAIDVHREYARRDPNEYGYYGLDCWGLSAGDGPGEGGSVSADANDRSFNTRPAAPPSVRTTGPSPLGRRSRHCPLRQRTLCPRCATSSRCIRSGPRRGGCRAASTGRRRVRTRAGGSPRGSSVSIRA